MFKRSLILMVVFAMMLIWVGGALAAENVRISRPANQPLDEWNKGALDRYMKENPDIKVVYETAPYNEYLAKLQTTYAAGGGSDIFFVTEIVPYIESGMSAAAPEWMAEDIRANYTDFAIEAVSWDGKVYGYPNEGGPRVMFYNKDLFAEAGITELPGDWEELREVAKKTTKYKGDMLTQQGIVTSWGPDGICVLGSFLYSNGGEWMSEDLTEPMFDQPESVEALKYWTELVTVDKVSSPAFVEDSFALGKSAMMVTGPWNIPHLTDVAPDLDYAAFLIPPKNKGDRFYVDDAPWVWMVNSNSKNQEESWKVLAFLHNNQNLVDYAIDAGGIPFKEEPIETLKGKLDTALPPKEAEVWKVFLESTKYSKLRPFRHYLDICFKFGAEMERALLGEITPEEAAKNGADKIRQTIKEMGK